MISISVLMWGKWKQRTIYKELKQAIVSNDTKCSINALKNISAFLGLSRGKLTVHSGHWALALYNDVCVVLELLK